MKQDSLILLNYQDNFADNLSTIAYGKILEKKRGIKCYFENLTSKRANFDDKMAAFNYECKFISSSRVEDIDKKHVIDISKIKREIKSKKRKNGVLDVNRYKIDDISYISDDIRNMFDFNNLDFIKNHDILETINQSESIGLFINDSDISQVDYNYIYRATKTINKYVKKPKLFIFAHESVKSKIRSMIEFKLYNFYDWREEFYFLASCKHKIILNAQNSYSEGFWSAILREKDYNLNIYDKKFDSTKAKTKRNWIGI